jgi:hypothetical protein
MRIVAIVALASLALTSLGGAASAAGAGKAKKAWNPDEVVCKVRLLGGSRLARIRECATRQQWAEHKQQEQLGLMRKQYNGSP